MVLFVVASAFFSMSETVFSSANAIRIKTNIEDGIAGSKKAFWIIEHFDLTITTILVGNNLANIALVTISVNFWSSIFVGQEVLVNYMNTGVMTIIVLIFGEILPKSFARNYADNIAVRISGVFYYIILILRPITWGFLKLKGWIVKDNLEERVSVTGDELETIIDTMEEEGSIDEDEAEMLQSVLDIQKQKVYEIMTPRVDMVSIASDMDIEEVKKIFFAHQFTRIPIFEGNRDNIIGVLHERDFFTKLIKGQKVQIKQLMKEPFFVSKSMRVDTLIETLQRENTHMAIVSGEYGGTSGLVTMEDALEELVGEIYDEHDEIDGDMIVAIKENKYGIDADIDLEDLFEELNLGPEPESSYSSLGGWLYDMFEDIPEVDETYVYRQVIPSYEHDDETETILILKFTVKDLKERRISYVNLTVEEETEDE
jgi:CBS domain containing-hemolysin-like protein